MPDPQMMFYGAAGLAAVFFVALVATAVSLRGKRSQAVALRDELAELRRRHEELSGSAERQGALLEERESTLDSLRDELAEVHRARSEAETARAQKAESLRHVEQVRDELRQERETLRESHRELQQEHSALQSTHAALKADTDGKLASAEEKIGQLKEMREEMSRRFEELAQTTLRRTGADVSKAHHEKLNELLTPFREHVGRLQEELRTVHKSADTERARLGEQIKQLTERSDLIRSEAENLTRALKGEKQRQGAWGEMILERLLEESGLERGTHYETQVNHTGDDGSRLRPDVEVYMPEGKSIVVDSKVSLVAYEEAVNAETEEERAAAIKRHVTAIKAHIDTLADKGYHALTRGSVDYVLMFMPIEGALSEALREQGDITSYAISRRVGIMTPTTLMVTLRTVDHVWAVQRRESNAEAIADRAGKLYDKVAGFVSSMETVGTALGKASDAHAKAMDQLSRGRGNVLGQVDKLRVMGARTDKRIGTDFDPEAVEEDEAPEALPRPAAE